MDIAEVARRSGVAASTLRFYEEKGLIASVGRRQLSAKVDEIDRTVKRLQAVSKSLRHAAVCPAPSHMECPTFRRLLQAAGTGTRAQRSKRVPSARD